MDEKSKTALRAAEALAKYTKVEPGPEGKVKGKGKLFNGNKLTKSEYSRSLTGLSNQVARLEIDQARRMSRYVLEKRSDAASLIETIRQTSTTIEKERPSGRTIDPLNPNAPGVANVCLMETNTKLDRLTAVFSGRDLEAAYTDEMQARQCEDIESLLQGREVSQQKRDVGQHEELEQLALLLSSSLSPTSGSQMAGTTVNTARGPGGPATQFPTLGGMQPPTTARRVDIRPKCLTARAPADPNQEDTQQSLNPPPMAGPSGEGPPGMMGGVGGPNWGGQTQVAGQQQMPAAPGPTQIAVGGP